jgi:ABC-type multidrug transport system ATPase subunit/pSer/pThr/pTyr-binding forkhead associated (FHA) protein
MLMGPTVGQIYELSQTDTVIGREEDAQIVIPNPAISRHHARLTYQAGRYLVEDLGSANGTFINGQRLAGPQAVNSGDRIALGEAAVFEIEAVGAPVPPWQPPKTVVDHVPLPPPAGAHPRPGYAPEQSDIPATQIYDNLEKPFGQQLQNAPKLVVSVAGGGSQTYPLIKAVIKIGREEGNDIIVPSNIVSRHHASLEKTEQGFRLVVQPGNTNETYLDGQMVSSSSLLRHNNVMRIGSQEAGLMVTMTYLAQAEAAKPQTRSITIGSEARLQIGRHPSNDLVLDSPAVSGFHAEIERVGQRYRIRDLRSLNGTFVNDQPVFDEVWGKPQDTIRIGPYRFVLGQEQMAQFDESGGLEVEAFGLKKWVRKDLNLLQDISLALKPREFVVVVGQSGGGKTTLVDAVAGYRPATDGQVFVNGIDLYHNFDAVRSNIGYVPQRDIIHMELTVYQALDYSAKLRMPPDTSPDERHNRIMEVLKDLDLEHRKDIQISRLSGGQQKRVSIGVELLTKPGLFFLDEPTSGLDPGTETALMQLMRRLADQGRTIVLITHATKNVMLADKVVFLARGGYLAWFGPPDEALEYFHDYGSERDRRSGSMDFDQIYAILEEPSKGSPQDWGNRYKSHAAFQKYVIQPLQQKGYTLPPQMLAGAGAQPDAGLQQAAARPAISRRPVRKQASAPGLLTAVRQFFILSSRNLKILGRDRSSLFLMLAAAPLVGMLDFVLAFGMKQNPFDYQNGDFFPVALSLFIFTIYGILVGGLSQMREIVKEDAVYKRERLVNLQILPYVLSKMWVAGLLALYHAAAYTILHYLAFTMPGGWVEFGLFYATMALATFAGMMMGLFASALSPNQNSVPLIVILLMIPQIVISGALIPLPHPVTAIASSRWGFEAFMIITGVGSDVAADTCWKLPEDQQNALSMDDKIKAGCRCMGVKALNQKSCNFPGLGAYYDPAIDQPKPQAPTPVGDPPAKPTLPAPPQEPANKNDPIAMNNYLEALKVQQANVEKLQSDYQSKIDDYQKLVDQYQKDVLAYQEKLGKWEIARNGSVGLAEGIIRRFLEHFDWAIVDKQDKALYTETIAKTWGAQGVIILVFFVLILASMKLKDRA